MHDGDSAHVYVVWLIQWKKLPICAVKPKINIFLYAPTEVILSRKQELDKDSIEELTANYLTLFSKLSKKYKKSKFALFKGIYRGILSWMNGIFNSEKSSSVIYIFSKN